jgi:hypothetical protein
LQVLALLSVQALAAHSVQIRQLERVRQQVQVLRQVQALAVQPVQAL